MKEKITIPLKDKVAVLSIECFDTDIDTDELVKIQYHNLIGEILTFPVLMNRIGNLKAEIEEILAETRLAVDIGTAELKEYYRRNLTINSDSAKAKKPTVDEVESAVQMDLKYINLRKRLIRVQREVSNIDSLYWAAKSKDDKLNRLSDKLRPQEFEGEIIEDTINGISFKIKNNLIK